jgi:protein dithiol oxidoreductase (disulfide-forming)
LSERVFLTGLSRIGSSQYFQKSSHNSRLKEGRQINVVVNTYPTTKSTTMRANTKFLVSILLLSATLSTKASPASPQEGVDFLTLPGNLNDVKASTLNVLSTPRIGNKVTVIELFAYFCPHCNALDSALNGWASKQGENVVFKRVHAAWAGNARSEAQQRFFYTLEAMGRGEELHKDILAEIHVNKHPLDNEQAFVDFVAKHGIERAAFLQAYNSPAVKEAILRANQLQLDMKVHAVPAVVIDGRYLTGPQLFMKNGAVQEKCNVGSDKRPEAIESCAQSAALQTMDSLISGARASRNQAGDRN